MPYANAAATAAAAPPPEKRPRLDETAADVTTNTRIPEDEWIAKHGDSVQVNPITTPSFLSMHGSNEER